MPRTWVTTTIVALNVVAAAAILVPGVITGRESPLDSLMQSPTALLLKWGAAYAPWILGGEWWRLLASAFLHSGVVHLALNMWCLLLAGPLLERMLGRTAFAVVYLLTALGGSLASLAWRQDIVGVGASGAVFGCYGALFAAAVRLRGTMPTEALQKLRSSVTAFVLYNVAYGATKPNVDHAAHIGGLVSGFVLVCLSFRASPQEKVQSPVLRVSARFATAAIAALSLLAVGSFVRAANSDGVRVQIGWQKVSACEASGQWDEALRTLDGMLEIAPQDASIHSGRSYALFKEGRNEDALTAVDRAIAIDSRPAPAHANRAWYLAALGRHAEGVKSAQHAVLLDSDLADARYVLVDCLLKLDRHEEALAQTRVLVRIDGENAQSHRVHSWVLFRLGRNEEALEAIDVALAIEPKDEWSLAHRESLRVAKR